MSLSQLTLLPEKNSHIRLSDRDIVSLFTNASRGVVDFEYMQNRKQTVDVIELMQIVGTEMGKFDAFFECVPDFKGSVQENTKCGSLDELDVAMKLVNFAKHYDYTLLPVDDYHLAAGFIKMPQYQRYWNDGAPQFASVRLCADFCQIFIMALGTKPVSQFQKRSGIWY